MSSIVHSTLLYPDIFTKKQVIHQLYLAIEILESTDSETYEFDIFSPTLKANEKDDELDIIE